MVTAHHHTVLARYRPVICSIAFDQANANPNTDGSMIQFILMVFGTPQTITLSSTLTLSEIAGPEEDRWPRGEPRDDQRK